MKRLQANAVITVFFSLLAAAFLGFVFMLVESARIQGARAQTANITDMAGYSVFGEYEKKLMEDYEVYGLDGSYGSGDFSVERVNGRLADYLRKNTEPAEGLAGLCFDPWKLTLSSSNVDGYAFLSDQCGNLFYQQVLAYMHETAITQVAAKLYDWYQMAVKGKKAEEDYKHARERSDAEMDDLEEEEERIESEMTEEEKRRRALEAIRQANGLNPDGSSSVVNPLDLLKILQCKPLPELVTVDNPVSGRSVSSSDLLSKRGAARSGNMTVPAPYGGIMDDLYFREYLLDRFSCYTKEKKNGALLYQIEYILEGKMTDRENLKEVAFELIMLREGCNYLHAVTDSSMNNACRNLAYLLIGWTGSEGLVDILQTGLLLGWCYGESILDVRTLLDGGKVPLFKSVGDWRLTLDQLGQLDELLMQDQSGKGEGMTYRGYLRLLLDLHTVEEQKARGLDMVELNLRSDGKLSNFRADNCLVAMKDETSWQIAPVFSRVTGAMLGIAGQTMSVQVRGGFGYEQP